MLLQEVLHSAVIQTAGRTVGDDDGEPFHYIEQRKRDQRSTALLYQIKTKKRINASSLQTLMEMKFLSDLDILRPAMCKCPGMRQCAACVAYKQCIRTGQWRIAVRQCVCMQRGSASEQTGDTAIERRQAHEPVCIQTLAHSWLQLCASHCACVHQHITSHRHITPRRAAAEQTNDSSFSKRTTTGEEDQKAIP